MDLDDFFSTDDIDPEISALLADDSPPASRAQKTAAAKTKTSAGTSFGSLYGDMGVDGQAKDSNPAKVDLSVTRFKPVERFFEEKPHGIFDDPNYYKTALADEGARAQKIHTLLSKFLSAQDPKDRSVFRQQIVTAYWDLLQGVIPKAAAQNAAPQKRYMLRFGMLAPSMLTPAQRALFAKVIDKNIYGEPVYYLDEWFSDISRGVLNPSTTDEAKVTKNDETAHLQQLRNRAQGKLQSAENLLKAKSDERTSLENSLKEKLENVSRHDSMSGFMHLKAPYTEQQKRLIQDIGEEIKKLLKMDRELVSYVGDFNQADADVRAITERIRDAGGGANTQSAVGELDTIRQMTKMTVGRQGNHFPILNKEYFHNTERDIGTRENVLKILAWIESVDVEAYCRVYKNQLNRIVPYTILIPSYGDYGICWEPFDRYNRVTSRGRIAVPMYPKNLTLAVLTAVADLRWQVAKEKASYYWMEEGLTGNYYQYVQSKKLKGDLKDLFVNDYILWMTKESEGVQRLDKEVRGIFWRYMPFSQEVKDKLKTRSYVYQELCQRDHNRQISAGY